MQSLLEKTRTINRMALKSVGSSVDFNYVARVISDIVEANVYILDKEGKILGYTHMEGFLCDIMTSILDKQEGFPPSYNENLLRMNETSSNFSQVDNACVFSGKYCSFNNKIITTVPIVSTGARLGTLVLARFDRYFTDEDLVLGEYAATVVALEMIRTRSKKIEEEARKRVAVQIALATLSYSELDAIQNIFEELGGDEGLLVASKVADRVGITRSVIVNALRKFESAGIIESRSLGMKGTYIRILNEYLPRELEKLNIARK
jgi:transcriptional pleiotropic repressor